MARQQITLKEGKESFTFSVDDKGQYAPEHPYSSDRNRRFIERNNIRVIGGLCNIKRYAEKE